jgi:hypothetical protein
MKALSNRKSASRRYATTLVLAAVLAGPASALDFTAAPPDAGLVQVNLGAGFGLPLAGGIIVPPLSVSVDFSLGPVILGVQTGLNVSRYYPAPQAFDDYYWEYKAAAVAVRLGCHPDLGIPNLDVYAVGALGYYFYSGEEVRPADFPSLPPDAPADHSQFLYGGYLGARWFFREHIGVFLEGGYSFFTCVQGGLSFRF